jgi:prepilin-type N-terminal cleavage/methylation domain-containing protein/prepilin-type processing-associated H-X9-DG protein
MTRNSFRVPRPNGFSLVELLVVIAIIAVLLALMLPSLSASRANSKSLLCLANERQMYGVFNQYAFRHPNETANVLYMDGHATGSQHYRFTNKYLFNWKYP